MEGKNQMQNWQKKLIPVLWRSERSHRVPRRKIISLNKGPPSPPSIFAKLEGLRKNENIEKAKRQTEILETVCAICTANLEGLLNISSQYSTPSQLRTNFHT